MATVDKNFKVKHGLVVEGTTATVNGDNIVTETASQTLSNKEFAGETKFHAANGAGRLSIDLNGTTGTTTITGNNGDLNIVTNTGDIVLNADGSAYVGNNASSDNLIATRGYVNGNPGSFVTSQGAKDAAATLITSATKTNITITGDGNGLTITAENGVADSTTDDLTEGTVNKYFTAQRALDATTSAYDAAGAASTAETNAKNYANGLASNYDAAGAASAAETNAKNYADGLASNYDAAGSASTAETNAKNYADGLASNYDLAGAAAAALTSANGYTDTAVSNLVDGAPALLNTLNELAAAINDDAGFSATITTSIGGKVAKAGDTMTGALTLSGAPTLDLHAATKKYVDDTVIGGLGVLNSDGVTEGTTNLYFTNQRAIDAIGANPSFTSVDINSIAKQVAATASLTASTTATVYSFAKATYRAAKFIVKVSNGTDTEVSEILLTLDSSDNVAITEYAIVGTNGSLSAISAAVSGSNVNLTVTATGNGTAKVTGTLLA